MKETFEKCDLLTHSSSLKLFFFSTDLDPIPDPPDLFTCVLSVLMENNELYDGTYSLHYTVHDGN